MIPWRFEIELETTYANADYQNTYFGVSRADAITSGLPQYTAGSSFRDVTLNANIGLFTSPKWGVFARLGFSKLLNDAADSPVTDHGDTAQYFAGVGLFYRF